MKAVGTPSQKINSLGMVEAVGVERKNEVLDQQLNLFSMAYRMSKKTKIARSWYKFGTVLAQKYGGKSAAFRTAYALQMLRGSRLMRDYGETFAATTSLFRWFQTQT
jgi:hypothetical protein